MENKLLKFNEILCGLRDYADELGYWSEEYAEDLSNEINGLFYIINYLDNYQDDMIDELERNEKK